MMYRTPCGNIFLEDYDNRFRKILKGYVGSSRYRDKCSNGCKTSELCKDCFVHYKDCLEKKGWHHFIQCLRRAGVKELDAETIAEFSFAYDLVEAKIELRTMEIVWALEYVIYYGENEPFRLLARRVTRKDYAINTVDFGSVKISPPPSPYDRF